MYAIVQFDLAEFFNVRETSCHPYFKDNCPTICHKCWPFIPSRQVHLFVSSFTKKNEDTG